MVVVVNAVGGGLLVGFHCSYCDKVADGAKNSVIVPDQLNLDFIVSLFYGVGIGIGLLEWGFIPFVPGVYFFFFGLGDFCVEFNYYYYYYSVCHYGVLAVQYLLFYFKLSDIFHPCLHLFKPYII